MEAGADTGWTISLVAGFSVFFSGCVVYTFFFYLSSGFFVVKMRGGE